MKILPPGSMRRQRRIGRIEGSLFAVALTLTIGAAVVAATPTELYRSAPSTAHPVPGPVGATTKPVDTPPCIDMGAKDCMGIESPHPRAGAQIAPHFDYLPWRELPVRTVSTPSALLLIVAAALAWIAAGLVVARAMSINGDDKDECQ